VPDLQQTTQHTAGDPIPAKCEVIELHVAELKQLFNAIDPSPFREKDLDPNAEEFIVSWAREVSGESQLALLVYLDRPAGLSEEPAILRDAVREFFTYRKESARRRLSQSFRVGRKSLFIGITCLTVSIGVSDFVANVLAGQRIGEILHESLLIGGWVAMWRPLEIFLYDWWPIRAEGTLFDRLAAMPVRIAYTEDATSEKWRWNWPAVPAAERPVLAPHGSNESIARDTCSCRSALPKA
jgi:hypothetical protein